MVETENIAIIAIIAVVAVVGLLAQTGANAVLTGQATRGQNLGPGVRCDSISWGQCIEPGSELAELFPGKDIAKCNINGRVVAYNCAVGCETSEEDPGRHDRCA